MSSNTLQRILYVEDEPDIQAVARMALEAVGAGAGFQLGADDRAGATCGEGAAGRARRGPGHRQAGFPCAP